MSKAVVCIAESQEQAKAILNELMSAGFSRNDVSVIEVFDLCPRQNGDNRKNATPKAEAVPGMRSTRASHKSHGEW